MKSAGDEEKLNLLKSVQVFSALDDSALEIIAQHSEYYDFPEGSTVFEKGSRNAALGVITKGEVVFRKEVETAWGGSREIEVARYVAGNTFGELDLIKEDLIRDTRAEAVAYSRVLLFPRIGEQFDELLNNYPHLLGIVLAEFMKIVAARIRETNRLIALNEPWVREIRRQVSVDKLTGLYNASMLEEEISRFFSSPSSYGVLLMVKPDNFKEVNDHYGHETGDKVLRLMGTEIRKIVGERGITCRYRGNEIGCFLPDADMKEALDYAENIREGIISMDLSAYIGDSAMRLILSVGISSTFSRSTGAIKIIEEAHHRVFTARELGGNRIISSEESV